MTPMDLFTPRTIGLFSETRQWRYQLTIDVGSVNRIRQMAPTAQERATWWNASHISFIWLISLQMLLIPYSSTNCIGSYLWIT